MDANAKKTYGKYELMQKYVELMLSSTNEIIKSPVTKSEADN